MAKLVDALCSGRSVGNHVKVRILSWARRPLNFVEGFLHFRSRASLIAEADECKNERAKRVEAFGYTPRRSIRISGANPFLGTLMACKSMICKQFFFSVSHFFSLLFAYSHLFDTKMTLVMTHKIDGFPPSQKLHRPSQELHTNFTEPPHNFTRIHANHPRKIMPSDSGCNQTLGAPFNELIKSTRSPLTRSSSRIIGKAASK